MSRPFDRIDDDEREDVPAVMPEIVLMSDVYGTVDLDADPTEDRWDDRTGARRETDPAAGDAATVVGATQAPPVGDAATVVGPTQAPPADAATPTTFAPTVPPQATPSNRTAPVEPVTHEHHRLRRRRRRWPWVLLAAVLLLAAAGAYFAVSLWQVWSAGRDDQARPVDAIVVMGAAQYDGTPSPQLAARLDHVVTLWNEGLAPIVVATGGNRPGDRFTEAEASAAYLAERGVPTSAILLENDGANTYESLESVAAMLEERGASEVLIVTDPYHALRSRLTADQLGLTAYSSPTPSSVVGGWGAVRRQVGEAAGVALGRIIGFDRLSGLTS